MGRLAGVVFDLDDTLAPDTTTQFLATLGVDTRAFWRRVVARMRDGWDQVPAYMFEFLAESSRATSPFSRTAMQTAGGSLRLHPGVEGLFEMVREIAQEDAVEAEFYLISSGLRPLVDALPVAREFKAVWASDFTYDELDRPLFIKNVVSYTDKTRALVSISKGISRETELRKPFSVNARVEHYRIPFERMIFFGDGMTDIPCFAVISSHGGTAVAVYRRRSRLSRGRADSYLADRRVDAVVPADFRRSAPAAEVLRTTLRRIGAAGDKTE